MVAKLPAYPGVLLPGILLPLQELLVATCLLQLSILWVLLAIEACLLVIVRERIEAEPWDVPLDGAATEDGFEWFRGRRGDG